MPVAGFCSAKLVLRAAAVASEELRFWSMRPANLPEEAEDYSNGRKISMSAQE
jgi:hypothetical protein